MQYVPPPLSISPDLNLLQVRFWRQFGGGRLSPSMATPLDIRIVTLETQKRRS